MDQRVHVPIDDPNADTEWNDILRKHGVIPEKPPSPTPIIQEALEEARKQAHENRLEDKDLDELNELEDEEDEAFLEKYHNQRMAELSTIATASVFNQVYPLQKPDYSKDVTEASDKAFVLVHLTSSLGTNIESRLLTELWREMARKFGDIKFCEIRADMCIEGYPERNTPTILIYRDGDIKKQVVTLRELNGQDTTIRDVQNLLVGVGALKPKDHRVVSSAQTDREDPYRSIRSGNINAAKAEDDDDWD
ncbi:hypothetical protein OEA41_005890 [Lepraria neglecta]|uniref:Phosducin domain-containing protein n=1 Tax=Lepraria neglecta TaxID=209136 RepID=A0AAD9Z7V8_9LECA|nr:hypothetical protein OEA41_005890 [Lepraria neglecta]